MGSKQVNEFSISGKVEYVGEEESVSPNLTKRILIMEVWDKRYRQEVPFEFLNKNIALLDNIQEGDWVVVDFVLKGRRDKKFSGNRWFGNMEAVSCIIED